MGAPDGVVPPADHPGPGPVLEVRIGGQRHTVTPGGALRLGRDEAADVQVLGPRVSREHLLVRAGPDGGQLLDRSRNGSFVAGRAFREMPVRGPVTVRLSDAQAGPEVHVAPVPAPTDGERTARVAAAERSSAQGRLSAVHQLATAADPASAPRVRIGRAEDNDVVVGPSGAGKSPCCAR